MGPGEKLVHTNRILPRLIPEAGTDHVKEQYEKHMREVWTAMTARAHEGKHAKSGQAIMWAKVRRSWAFYGTMLKNTIAFNPFYGLRKRLKLSLRDMSSLTKIPQSHLRELEFLGKAKGTSSIWLGAGLRETDLHSWVVLKTSLARARKRIVMGCVNIDSIIEDARWVIPTEGAKK